MPLTATLGRGATLSTSLAQKVAAAELAGKNAVFVTRQELVDLLKQICRATYTQFVGITTVTEPKWRGGKKNPMHGKGIQKISEYTCQFGVFAKRVENQMQRDGVENPKYEVAAPIAKEYVGDSPLCIGNGKSNVGTLYVAIIPTRNGNATVEYIDPLGHDVTAAAKVEVYTPPKRQAKQAAAGVKNDIVFRTPKLSNVIRVALGGLQFYVISGSAAPTV